MDMWTGDVSPGMLIFGDVYSCSIWIIHTGTPSLHTNGLIDMDKNLDKFVCWSYCSVMLLQCQLDSSTSNKAVFSSAIQHQAINKEHSVLCIWLNNVIMSSQVQRLDYLMAAEYTRVIV